MRKRDKPIRLRRPSSVEWSRLVSHLFAAIWPIMFLLVTPAAFSIVSQGIIHVWMPVAIFAAAGAIVGVITRVDLKIELPALYLLLVGPVIYLVAQVGIILTGIDDAFQSRFALCFFILWQISLLVPRVVELERVRRRERLKSKVGP